ncbi:MAG: arginine--tRNA ligase [Patescibacteria group bacterium]
MSVYTWDAVLSHVARKIGEATNSTIEISDLAVPPDPDLGDIAFGCFKLAKAQGKSPADVAKDLAAKLGKKDPTIESASAAGPYLNICLRPGDLAARVIQDIGHFTSKYGQSDEGKQRELMLEYAQPNTHKEIHVGHLRNLILGAALARLLQNDGYKVVTASYHGDVGAHVAKCLWFLVRANAAAVPQPKKLAAQKGDGWVDYVLENLDEKMAESILQAIPKEKHSGRHLGSIYSEATKLLDENAEWKEQVSRVQQAIEAKKPGWLKLWQETKRWSTTEMNDIFRELGVALDRQYFESEVQDNGQRIVDELLKKNLAQESQGAIIVDLEKYKLGPFLIRKTDGTSLYATKDLALAQLKFREYPKLTRSLHVIDNRQNLYFRQLGKTLELMGFKQPLEFVGYEFLTLKSGAMSSRQGNVVAYETFRDEVVAFARKETQTRHADWPEGKLDHVAWALAMGGIKYGMLKQDSDKIIVFDLEKALSFDGDTGPYIQYAATRLNSILKKAGWDAKSFGQGDGTLLKEKAEKKLVLKLAQFPALASRVARELKPMPLAQWCFTTAQTVGEFYRDVPVLEAPPKIKAARLDLAAAASSVLILGLNLLGIPIPDEM